jgi:hypothetical protein
MGSGIAPAPFRRIQSRHRLDPPRAEVSMSSSSRPFLEARDFLLAHRTDYDTARREFRLAPYKRIRRMITDLPKTISGRIRRSELSRVEKQRRLSSGRGEHEFFEEDFGELRA